MADSSLYSRLRLLSEHTAFAKLVQFNEDQRKAQRDIEYLMRFLVYRYVRYDGKKDVEEYITDGMIEIAEKQILTTEAEQNFRDTFGLLEGALGEDALKHYSDGEFKGRVGLTALEVVAAGISFNLPAITKRKRPEKFVSDRVKAVWDVDDVKSFSRAGLTGTQRIQKSIPFGHSWFAP